MHFKVCGQSISFARKLIELLPQRRVKQRLLAEKPATAKVFLYQKFGKYNYEKNTQIIMKFLKNLYYLREFQTLNAAVEFMEYCNFRNDCEYEFNFAALTLWNLKEYKDWYEKMYEKYSKKFEKKFEKISTGKPFIYPTDKTVYEIKKLSNSYEVKFFKLEEIPTKEIDKNLAIYQMYLEILDDYDNCEYTFCIQKIEFYFLKEEHCDTLYNYYSLFDKLYVHAILKESNKNLFLTYSEEKIYLSVISQLSKTLESSISISKFDFSVFSNLGVWKANHYFWFGKYKGQKLAQVLQTDPKYIIWCVINLPFITLELKELLRLKYLPNYLDAVKANSIKKDYFFEFDRCLRTDLMNFENASGIFEEDEEDDHFKLWIEAGKEEEGRMDRETNGFWRWNVD